MRKKKADLANATRDRLDIVKKVCVLLSVLLSVCLSVCVCVCVCVCVQACSMIKKACTLCTYVSAYAYSNCYCTGILHLQSLHSGPVTQAPVFQVIPDKFVLCPNQTQVITVEGKCVK